MSVVEFRYSEIIVFEIYTNFKYDSETWYRETWFWFFEMLFFS